MSTTSFVAGLMSSLPQCKDPLTALHLFCTDSLLFSLKGPLPSFCSISEQSLLLAYPPPSLLKSSIMSHSAFPCINSESQPFCPPPPLDHFSAFFLFPHFITSFWRLRSTPVALGMRVHPRSLALKLFPLSFSQ